jgi:hypothetical protein
MRLKTIALSTALGAALALSGLPAPSMAESVRSDAEGREALRLVIYSAGLGQIDERRLIELPAGQHELVLSDVSPQLQPETVLLSGAGLTVSAQSFRYDPLSRRRLLEEALGQQVWVRRRGDDDDDDRLEEGRLLSVGEGPVVRIDERIETVDPAAIVFAELPPGLTARPVLRADVMSEAGGRQELRLRYLATGLAWHADYIATWYPDSDRMDLISLVSLVNQAGMDIEQAEVRLLAGEVAQAPRPGVPMARQQMATMTADAEMGGAPGVQTRSFSDRHLYGLPGKIDLARGETRQVRLFSATDVAVEKRFRLENLIQTGRAPEELGPLHPQILLRLRNEAKAGLGRPLPAGRMRIYQPLSQNGDGDQDAKEGEPGEGAIFVGAAGLDHVAEGESAELSLGEAFDISARAWLTEFRRISTTSGAYETGQRAELVNGGKEAVSVELVGHMPAGWRMLKETTSHTRESGNRIRWDIQIPAGGKAAFEYRIRVTP